MSEDRTEAKRDEVLFAFQRAHERPSAENIIEWIKRHPDYADDIREHAALMLEMALLAEADDPAGEPSAVLLSRGRSRALSAVHNAQIADGAAMNDAASFEVIIATRHTSIPDIARSIDIDRGILADLVKGRMLAPAGERLVSALTALLNITQDTFERALELAVQKPRLGMARSDRPPEAVQRTYGDIIRDSPMTSERKSYWLGED